MILAEVRIPPVEFLVFAVAVLLGLLGKVVAYAKRIREKSIEAEQKDESQFGADLEEAPEPQRAEPSPPSLELFRRPPRPRREEALVPPESPRPLPPPRAAPPPPKPRGEHEIIRMLRTPHGARNGVLLAEVLGRPKALRRGR